MTSSVTQPVIMVALCNRADLTSTHGVTLVFRMQVWNVLYAARWKYRTQKSRQNRHLGTIAQLCRAISS